MPASYMDIRRLRSRLSGVKNAAGEIQAATLRSLGGLLISRIAATAPRDTNRYVRGWMLAGIDAGVSNLPPPPIGESKRVEQNIQRLERQFLAARGLADRLQNRYDNWYGRKGRKPGAYGSRLQRDIDKANERANRAYSSLQELQTVKGAIFIGGSGNRNARPNPAGRGFNQRYGLGRLATVRTKIYGGRGQIITQKYYASLLLHNMEPHATIVESRHRTYRNARSAVPGLVGMGATANFTKAVRRAWEGSGGTGLGEVGGRNVGSVYDPLR